MAAIITDQIRILNAGNFVAGVSNIKISIMVNGKNVFQDKLSIIDRLINKVFRKK